MSAEKSTPGRLGGWLASPPPSVAVEVARDRVAAVAVTGSGGDAAIAAYAIEPLPSGVVDPILNAPNVLDATRLAEGITSVLGKLPHRTRRIALVLPDTVAKVSLVRFEKVPPRVQDLGQLIRWQVRKAAPFRIEDAKVAWIGGASLPEGGREFVVTTIRKDVLESYERACDAAGVHAGLVDLATFNLINAVLASGDAPAADWLLVHVGSDYITQAVIRGRDLVSFRNRTTTIESDLTDLVHQTAMYHEDRLGGGGFSRVILAGAAIQGADVAERLRRGIEERLRTRVELLDFRAAASMRDRIAANPALLDALAPAVGILVRERKSRRGSAAAGRVA